MSRFFLKELFLEGKEYRLAGEESHHLTNVLRKRSGDVIELVNGFGESASARIVSVGKHGVELVLLAVTPLPSFPLKFTLALGIPLQNHLDWVIEKGTELGVFQFLLFPAKKSSRQSISKSHQERMERMIISALKQSGRGYLPEIKLAPPLEKWERPSCPFFFGELGSQPLPSPLPKEGDVIFAIGPESGWDDGEKERLIFLGATPVSIHSLTLRAETAAIAASTLFLSNH